MNNERIILHADFNSFFASVEQQANPFLRGKPIAVAGKQHGKMGKQELRRTIITTASLEAKKRGVKTAMSSIEALRICPDLIIVPGDPKKYSFATERFLSILSKYASSVEQFSLDEAFADITECAGDFFGAVFIAQMIRRDIAMEVGDYCTVSIGIANNKMLAKLASESEKPNGLTIVEPKQASKFVERMNLADICGIGPAILGRLESFGITSPRLLRTIPLHALMQEFGEYGLFLFEASRGLGNSIVEPNQAPPKSIGHSYTFDTDLDTEQELRANLLALSDRVASRMRKLNLSAMTVHAYIRYGERGGVGGQHTVSAPMEDGLEIFLNALEVLNTKRDHHKGARLLAVSVSQFVPAQRHHTLFDPEAKRSRVLESLDDLEQKHGTGIWQRGTTMNTEFKERVSGWHYDHEL